MVAVCQAQAGQAHRHAGNDCQNQQGHSWKSWVVGFVFHDTNGGAAVDFFPSAEEVAKAKPSRPVTAIPATPAGAPGASGARIVP